MRTSIVRVPAISKKKYRVPTVAQVLGVSENSIYGFFGNRKITVKGGITADQVVEFLTCNGTRETGAINWEEATDLKDELLRRGFRIIWYAEDQIAGMEV